MALLSTSTMIFFLSRNNPFGVYRMVRYYWQPQSVMESMLFIVPFLFRKRCSWKPIGTQLFSRRVRDIRHLELSSLSLYNVSIERNFVIIANLKIK
jgi:hypothetical protein